MVLVIETDRVQLAGRRSEEAGIRQATDAPVELGQLSSQRAYRTTVANLSAAEMQNTMTTLRRCRWTLPP